LLAALLPIGIAAPSGVAIAEPAPGSIEALRHEEAKLALDAGDFERARHLYYILVRVDPTDALAYREAGRASHALGQFEFAVEELTRADQLQGHAADPELHYLLGEALFALGRTDQARRAQALALREVGPAPTERMQRLWLARSLARRDDLSGADAIYAVMAADDPGDEEVALSRIEAHTLNRDWSTAESLTRALLLAKPEHPRAREILAWVLEVRGAIGEELALRDAITRGAEETGTLDFDRTVAHGRSLERSRDYRGALARYRAAYDLDENGDPTLGAAIERLQHRLSPETSVAAAFRADPSGSSTEVRVGLAAPLTAEHSLSLTASYDVASSEATNVDANAGTLTAGLVLGRERDVTAAFMASGNYHSMSMDDDSVDTMHLGSAAELRIGTGRRVQVQARADFNMPWREAANTIREGGRYDGVTAHVYALPFGHRLVADVGIQARRMELADSMVAPGVDSRGRQTLIFGGVDYVVQADPTRVARGEILDDEMLWPTYVADALVLHYRHYEGFTDDEFGDRLVLSPRNTIDEVGATARRTVAGVLAGELRGGTGYDFSRDMTMWRAGGSLHLSPSASTRFTFSYDLANESTDAFVGRRHAGWLTFHADL
jgi:tetratricopeptide (TPR) repeat protein